MNFIKLPKVLAISNKSRSTVYAEIKAGRFPKPIKIGRRAVAWLDSEIEAWQSECIQKRSLKEEK